MTEPIRITIENYIDRSCCARCCHDIKAKQFNEDKFKCFSSDYQSEDIQKIILSKECTEPETNTFSIYTQNMWGLPFLSKQLDNRMSLLEEIMSQGKYDVLCLEEMWLRGDRTRLKEFGKDHKYIYNSDFATGSGSFLYPNFYGSGLLILSKYPIIDTSFVKYSINGNPLKIWHSDYYMEKGIGLSRINFHNKIIDIYITHTHAEYDPKHDEYAACRLSQLYQLAKYIKNTSQNNLSIVVGDFNIRPHSIYYNLFVTILNNIYDCWETKNKLYDNIGTYGNANNTYVNEAISDRLDYIFAYYNQTDSNSFGWTLKSCDIKSYHGQLTDGTNRRMSISLSDHEGIEGLFSYQQLSEEEKTDTPIHLSQEERLKNLQEAGRLFYEKYRHYQKKHIVTSIIGFVFILLWIVLFGFTLAYPELSSYFIYFIYLCPLLFVLLLTMSRYIYNSYSNNYYDYCNCILSDIYNLILKQNE